MGSYINIGIVYSDKSVYKLNSDLHTITKALLPLCDKIVINYPRDYSYKNWEEKLFVGEKGLVKAFEILNTKQMSFGKICCKSHNSDIHILVSIRSNGDLYRGILFEVSEKELLQENYSIENLNNVEDNIIKKLLELWSNTEFSYAFCDSDAEIKYQIIELEHSEEAIYSMLLLKNNFNQPIVKLSSWCIDGITPRNG